MFGLAYLLKLKYLIFSILHFHFYSFHLLGSLLSSFKIRLRGEKETYPQRMCKYIDVFQRYICRGVLGEVQQPTRLHPQGKLREPRVLL